MNILNRLNNIRLSNKMLMIAGMALVGVAVPTYFYLLISFNLQTVAHAELQGIEPATKTVQLIKNMVEHRGLAAKLLSGEQKVSSTIANKTAEVNSDLQSLTEMLTDTVSDDKINNLIVEIGRNWRTLSSSVSAQSIGSMSSFDQHSDLIMGVKKTLSQILNFYSLSYDPEPSSYHLIIASYEEMPQLTDALGRLRGLGAATLTTNEHSAQRKIEVQSMLIFVKYPLDRFIGAIEAAAKSDEHYKGLLPELLKLTQSINNLVQITDEQIIKTDVSTYTSDRYLNEFNDVIENLNAFNSKNIELLRRELSDRVENTAAERNRSIFVLIIFLSFGGGFGFFVVRSIVSSVNDFIDASNQIATGNYLAELDLSRKDEMGKLSQALRNMGQTLKDASDAAKEAGIVTSRILEALNSTSANVMIADAQRNIIYMNKTVKQMLTSVEKEMQRELPQFSVDKVVGSNMDIFHKNPAHQAALLDKLTKTYSAQIVVGSLHFRLVASPIFSDSKERLGSVVEWQNRTAEIEAEQEISALVVAANIGDFSKRVEVENKEGFMLSTAQGLNSLVRTTDLGLQDIATVLMALAEGDLTKRIETDYQGSFESLKNYCNETSEKLAEMISSIRLSVVTIASASSEIAQGNSDLSSRTEEQASSLEETASSMEELTGTVRLNSENATQANSLASDASTVAVEGGNIIQKVVATMSSINESARKIADIIGVIDGIAFQTNILALNAAVEAARAGEQGRGFAVVASEVRTLAQRSANAAKDIKELISDSVKKIETGNTLVNQSGDIMDKVVTSIKRVNDIMSEIAAASAEQATGIDEVGKAITQMDEVTQQNAALVEEAAAAAESLQSQAEQLATRVATFKLDDSYEEQHTPATKKLSKPTPSVKSASSIKKATLVQKKIKTASPEDDEWESF